MINIVRAQYGQPGGIKNGRGAFDVTDSLQARVHAARGAGSDCKGHGKAEINAELWLWF